MKLKQTKRWKKNRSHPINEIYIISKIVTLWSTWKGLSPLAAPNSARQLCRRPHN